MGAQHQPQRTLVMNPRRISWVFPLLLILGACESLFQRSEREMANGDAALHRYCLSLSPGMRWSPSGLPQGMRGEIDGDAWHVVGLGVAVCEINVDADGKIVSATFRPD
jgi:hypothetical protein